MAYSVHAMTPDDDLWFGDALGKLFEARPEWNAAKLAKALAIDASLVRRWLRNERIPPLKSDYVRKITDVLKLSGGERRTLEEAQIASYHARARGTLKARRNATTQGVADLLNTLAGGILAASTSDESQPPAPVKLPPNGAPISGVQEIVQAAIDLLQRACEQEEPSTIYWTFQSARDATEEAQMVEAWRVAIRQALGRGWQMEHVVRLDDNIDRSLSLVNDILMSMGRAGAYKPYYIKSAKSPLLPIDMLVVPEVGALFFLASENTEWVDSAIYLSLAGEPDSASSDWLLALLKRRFNLLKGQAEPLLKEYAENTSVAQDAILQMDEVAGDRFTMMDGPSAICRPPSLYLDEPPHQTTKDENSSKSYNRAQRRLEAILTQLATGEVIFRDVYPKRAIEKLAHDGALFLSDEVYTQSPLAPSRRIEALEAIIERLRSFDRFELALLDEEEEIRLLGETAGERLRAVWQIKGDKYVMFETRRGDGDRHEDLTIEITEPTIVRAFWRYAEDLWERISPRNKDKEYVIWWLERQIEEVKRLESEQGE